jgi:hypothetical protein
VRDFKCQTRTSFAPNFCVKLCVEFNEILCNFYIDFALNLMKFHVKFNKITRTELGARKPDWPKPSAPKLGRDKFIKAYEQDLASSKLKDKIYCYRSLRKNLPPPKLAGKFTTIVQNPGFGFKR